jgi:hypothetical protein
MKLFAVAAVAALFTGAAAAPNVSQQQADAFQQKLTRIVQQAESKSARPQETILTEGEVNSYLRFRAGPQLPVGVTDPSIGILGAGRLNGRAVVDLDVIRQKKSSGGWFDPTSYLTGRLPVTASGTLHTRDGKGRFELATAEVSGVPIPKAFLQELVSFYTRTDDNPDGINIDDVFDLPADIRSIAVDKGRATVVQ